MKFIYIATKDLKIFFKDIQALAMLIIAPIMMILIMGAAFPGEEGVSYAIPGMSIMFLLFACVMQGSMSILDERESGTLRRLMIAPVTRSSIIAGKVLAYYVLGLTQISVLMVLSHLVCGMNFGNISALITLVLATTAAASGLGMLVAVFSKTKPQGHTLSLVAIMFMSALGGSWWSVSMYPPLMEKIAYITTINAWAIDGLQNVMFHGYGLTEVAVDVCALLVFALAFFAVAVKSFRFE